MPTMSPVDRPPEELTEAGDIVVPVADDAAFNEEDGDVIVVVVIAETVLLGEPLAIGLVVGAKGEEESEGDALRGKDIDGQHPKPHVMSGLNLEPQQIARQFKEHHGVSTKRNVLNV
jgi:hypothetical protein